MKRLGNTLFVWLIVLILNVSSLANIKFSSNNAAISVASGARLVIDTASLRVDGTIVKEVGSSIVGNQISFERGVFNTDGVDVIMTASYSPSASGTISLAGNGKFVAPPGYVVQAINVSNKNNRIEGQPLLKSPITLAGDTSSVSLALQNALDENIVLNGGTVYLESDLVFADDTMFVGSGTITLSGHSLILGGAYTTSWSGDLVFDSASDLTLSGSVLLDGNWTFSGISVLNGNGAILDLSYGGTITVEHGSVLLVNDLTLTGIGGNGAGSIVFDGASSQLRTNNVTVRLVANTTTAKGNLYVQGPTTVIAGNKSWMFDHTGKLTVDGTTLFIDPLIFQSYSGGGIYAPLPLYGTSGLIQANVDFDIAAGNLEFLNDGVVRIVSESGSGGNPLNGSITTTVHLNGDIFFKPSEWCRIDGNIEIDGGGSAVYFSDPTSPEHSQLIISPGKILTLKNVRLLNLSSTTFNINANSRMYIDKNVLFELSQDITFSMGLIKLIPEGLNSDVFMVCGDDVRHQMLIAPLDETKILLQLGTNTLVLENIELSGFDYISHINGDLAGAVALTDNSQATFNNDTGMNFFIEGIDNAFAIQKDGIILSGNVSYGNQTDNDLHIKFAINSPLDSALETLYGAQSGNPIVVFAGDPGLYLSSSTNGLARLFFDDVSVSLVSAGENSVAIDMNAYLDCRNLELLGSIIKQYSALFTFNAVQLAGLQIDPAFIRFPSGILNPLFVLPTALHLKRQQHDECFEKIKQSIEAKRKKKEQQDAKKPTSTIQPIVPTNPKPVAKPKKNKQKPPARALEDFDGGLDVVGAMNIPRALRVGHTIPTVWDQTYPEMVFKPSGPLSRFLLFNTTFVYGFKVAVGSDLEIGLSSGSTLEQSLFDDIVYGAGQCIDIFGGHNVINVTKKMTFGTNEANLFFVAGGEVTFNFINTGQGTPEVIFAGNTLDLPERSIIRFSGSGKVTFNDGVIVNFLGSKIGDTVVQRPRFIVTDGAIMTLAENATVTMQGIGSVELSERGGICLSNAGMLIVGGDDTSDFRWSVIGDGFINLVATSGLAQMSFQRTSASITVSNSGMLLVGNNGRFEINAQEETFKQGTLVELFFRRNGFINMSGSGRFVAGYNGDTHSVLITFSWDGTLGQITGDGYASYIDAEPKTFKSFTGKLALQDPNIFTAIAAITSERLISLLVQKTPALTVSTDYTGLDGKHYLRTVDGISVLLHNGDVIVSDNGDIRDNCYGTVSGFDSEGVAFRYKRNGTRI